MARFDRSQDAEQSACEADEISGPFGVAMLHRLWLGAGESGEARGRLLAETSLIGLGALVLSFLLIWATVTDRVSIEAIVVLLVVLVLALFAMAQGLTYHARNLAIHERVRESVTKTTMAAEIMMEFLREFALKNQQTISQLAESHKVRVIDDLVKAVDDLLKTGGEATIRRELDALKDAIERKIMEIPTGVALPLPRLEHFDMALRHLEEAEHTPQCPACGMARAQIIKIDSRDGIQYACTHCNHEFNVGLTVMLEKTS